MEQTRTQSSMASARAVLSRRDFRRLFAARMASQVADGAFLATLLLTVVFLPERQGTAQGFALATAVLLLPFTLLEPFTGVFIDRWRRRRILVALPPLRAAAALLTLPYAAGVLVFSGALVVFSANRLYQATASAIIPRVVDEPEWAEQEAADATRGSAATHSPAGSRLFMANGIMAIGGAVAYFGGLFAGGLLAAAVGVPAVLAAACAIWCLAALGSATLSSSYAPERPASLALGEQVRAVTGQLLDGLRRIRRTPGALVPILAVTVGQLLQIMAIVVSLVVIRERLEGGLVSFSWLAAGGGAGVVLGFATVGGVGRRIAHRVLIGVAFAVAGLALVPAILAITPATLTLSAVLLGLSYAWTRVPADTLAQRAIPDRYRGRVFTVMDLGFNTARVAGALAAIPVIALLGPRGTLVALALLFLLWAPVTPLWLGRGRLRR